MTRRGRILTFDNITGLRIVGLQGYRDDKSSITVQVSPVRRPNRVLLDVMKSW